MRFCIVLNLNTNPAVLTRSRRTGMVVRDRLRNFSAKVITLTKTPLPAPYQCFGCLIISDHYAGPMPSILG